MAAFQVLQKRILTNNFACTCSMVRNTTTLIHATDYKRAQLESKKKVVKEPFVKNLFLGNFDVDMLSFPEVLEPEELDELEHKLMSIDHLMKQSKNSSYADRLKQMKSLGLFGMQVPVVYGGLNLSATEKVRYSEVISQDGPVAIALAANHALGLKGLLSVGSEEQKQRYLPRLASGEWIAAFGLAESPGNTHTIMETEAKLSLDKDKWLINGSKILITGDNTVDLCTIIAKTIHEEYDGTKSEGLTAFLVEGTSEGVTFEKSVDITGNRGISLCEVKFNKTPVPLNNVLGSVGEGYKLGADIIGSNRNCTGSFSTTILKQFLKQVSDHCIHQKQLGKHLMDFELIQQKIAKIVSSVYAIESMTYLTAGIIDTVENPDASIEAAIVKVYSSDKLNQCILECQSVLGSEDFLQDSVSDIIMRDSRVYMLLEGSNEVLRMFIALSGLQHAGLTLQDNVLKLRNPFFHPVYVFKKILNQRDHLNDAPKLVLGLHGYVHPSLVVSAKQLEYCVLRLQFLVEIILARHGNKIVEKEIDLNRLTDIVINIYVMTAVIARSSRSYCIGLQDSEKEIKIATAICQKKFYEVKWKAKQITEDFTLKEDHDCIELAKSTYSHKGYFYQHPLTRNF